MSNLKKNFNDNPNLNNTNLNNNLTESYFEKMCIKRIPFNKLGAQKKLGNL